MAAESHASTNPKVLFAAVAATVAFVWFTVWWLVDGGTRLDATFLRFTGWLLRGWLDVVISASWPLGEPLFVLASVAVIVAVSVVRRRFRAAALIVGGFVLLSALEVAIMVTLAEVRHVSFGVDSLSHLYPSGHTARVPFLGSVLAMIGGRRARGWLVIAAALLAIAVGLDRTDSTIQTGSAVVGGLLLGISISLWFVALFLAWNAGSVHEPE